MFTSSVLFQAYPCPEPGEKLLKFMRRCYVMEGEVEIRPSTQQTRRLYGGLIPTLQVTEEDVVSSRLHHEEEKLKMERFLAFCEEDGIDTKTFKKVLEDGRVGIYAPDALGYPTLVLYEGEL